MYSKDRELNDERRNGESTNTVFVKSDFYNEGMALFFQQIRATLCKRAVHQWRKRLLLVAQCCLLVATIGGSLILNGLLSVYRPKPPAKSMSVGAYSESQFLLAVDENLHNTTLIKTIKDFARKFGLKTFEPMSPSDNLNISKYILEQSAKSGVAEFMGSNYVGLSVKQTENSLNFTGYFNKWGVHSSSVVVNFMDNAILRTFCNECQLITDNYPLPQTTILYYSFGEDFIIVLCLAVGLAFFTTNFAASLVEERSNGAKHMQILAGLNPVAYWTATMAWDFPVYFLCSCCIALMWKLGGCNLLVDENAWLDMIMLLTLHGWAILPFNYLFSMAFGSPAAAITTMTAVNLMLNLVPTLAVTTLTALSFNDDSLKNAEKTVSDICSIIIPQFALSKSIIVYYSNRLMRKQCQAMKACDYLKSIQSDHFKITDNPLEWETPGIGRYLACLAGQGLVFVFLLALTEWWTLSLKRTLGGLLYTKFDNRIVPESLSDNGGVAAATKDPSLYVLDVQELHVKYRGQTRQAVERLSFRVAPGEIFGLNGENGSGKTTTYKILTGLLTPNHGVAYVNKVDAIKNWRQAAKYVGFCPQTDMLLEFMTADECLAHYCRLKGIQENDIDDIVASVLKAVGLNQYQNRVIKRYSGGNKRKISLAIALIGAPPVILLDEPTCGVDPKARRKIWKLLQIMKTLGCGIVLTSHDMEECETLCNRLMIMVQGKCKCSGSPQTLLDQYANVLNLKLTVDSTTDVETFKSGVEKLFKNSVLKAQPNAYQFHYAVPTSDKLLLSTAFKYIEMLKKFFVINDFALSQPTLHEVFVTITKKDT